MLRRSLFAALLLTASPVAASAADVVVSIRPLHSLVASIMKGAGEPTLLFQGQTDPHTAQLTPSMARSLSGADLVVWAGPDMSTGLIKPIESLASGTTVLNLAGEEDGHDDHSGHDHGEEKKEAKADDHNHDDHDHAKEAKADDHDHDDHDHAKEAKADDHDHDDHDHAKEAKADDHDHDEHDHAKEAKADDHDDHDHAKEAKADDHDHAHAHEGDPHVWLDPHEMEEAVGTIAAALSKADPENAATYKANAKALSETLEALEEELRSKTAAIRDSQTPIYQIHDAATHFMEHYELAKGATLLGGNTEGGSAKAMSDMREALAAKPGCLLIEPTTNAAQVTTLTEGRTTKVVTFDPLGRDIEAGPGQYEALLRSLGDAMADCVKSS